MKIGIDMDCVLNNLNEEWIRLYNDEYNDNLTIEDIHSWDISSYVKKECGNKIYDYLKFGSLFKKLSPLKDSVEVTKFLSKYHDLYVITATHYSNIEAKIEWLEEYFPHIGANQIIFCQDKSLINVDLLIDDGAHNIINFPNDTLVFDYAWNRSLSDKYKRVYSWLDVKAEVKNKFK